MDDFPKTGQKFHANGQVYKWVPYHKSVRDIYGAGRFQRMVWSGPKEDGDFFKWKNDDPTDGSEWEFTI